jgi:putative endonuclease
MIVRHCEDCEAKPKQDEAIHLLQCDMKQPAVYIVASRRNGTHYTDVTSNLPQRIWQHRQVGGTGFAARYGCKLLVWFELHDRMITAIEREKQIKAGSRARKIALIAAANPEWRDLYPDLF